MSKEVVNSPCISVCYLNEMDVCEGCYRSAEEITEWSALNNEGKRDVLEKAGERLKGMNKLILL